MRFCHKRSGLNRSAVHKFGIYVSHANTKLRFCLEFDGVQRNNVEFPNNEASVWTRNTFLRGFCKPPLALVESSVFVQGFETRG
jgi:hypothetical protein